MNAPIVREEIPEDLTGPSELTPDQLDQVAGGARHKLDIKYGGADSFYYPSANKT
jgi:hypothetical protein